MRKPVPLRRGDVIGVIAPAGAVDDVSLNAGICILENAGYRVKVGAAVRKKSGYLAGSDRDRLADLRAMLSDPEVRAIVAARGGYGSGRLLPCLDPSTARAYPKIFVGHSDLTFLLNDLVQRAGVVTFHGPMVAGLHARPEAAACLLAVLSGEPLGSPLAARDVVRPGTAEGVLVGGCLSIIVAMLGTPYAIETRARLLFLEDVNEKPYRVDRMLTQLRQAGALDGLAGVIFGEMSGCVAAPDESVCVRDVIAEVFRDASYPVAFGLPSGHGANTLALPLGIRARLAGGRLTMLESPLAERF